MKILMVNTYGGGANIAFKLLYEKYKNENEIDYIDLFDKFKIIPKKFRIISTHYIGILYSFFFQLSKKYDLVLVNYNIVIPLGRNIKCTYKNIIHHPYNCDMKIIKKIRLVDYIILFNEKISVFFCKNILTDSEFSRKNILKIYPNINCKIINIEMNPIFNEAKNKYKNKKREKIIFLPVLYGQDRKGGDFITPILIKLSHKLKKRKIKIIISKEVCKSQKKNYEKLCKHCEIEYLGDIKYEKLAELYSTSLLVLTPATLEGYGYVPLEVNAAGGKCISAPFPSLGFDNVSVNNPKRKVVVNGITVLEHDAELWEKEIIKNIEEIK